MLPDELLWPCHVVLPMVCVVQESLVLPMSSGKGLVQSGVVDLLKVDTTNLNAWSEKDVGSALTALTAQLDGTRLMFRKGVPRRVCNSRNLGQPATTSEKHTTDNDFANCTMPLCFVVCALLVFWFSVDAVLTCSFCSWKLSLHGMHISSHSLI